MSNRLPIPHTFTPERKALFLEVLAETCSPKLASQAVGIARSTAFYHRTNDLEFRQAWDRAVDEALDAVLEESYRRAVTGVDEPVIFQGAISKDAEGKLLTVKKYSDRLLEVLMKWRYGDQLADRLRVRVEESTGLSPEALLAMPSEERAQLVTLLSKYASSRPAKEDDHAQEE
jgi:hypothetical protein